MITEIVPASGWCSVDDDGAHTPIVAWALGEDPDARKLGRERMHYPHRSMWTVVGLETLPLQKAYAEDPDVFDIFIEGGVDLLVNCASQCPHYRPQALAGFEKTPKHPFRQLGISKWNALSLAPAHEWCAVYEGPNAEVHSPLAAWLLLEEPALKKRQPGWRSVIGVDASDGDSLGATGPDVYSSFLRYELCPAKPVKHRSL